MEELYTFNSHQLQQVVQSSSPKKNLKKYRKRIFSAHPTKSLLKNPSIAKIGNGIETDRPKIKSQKKVTFKEIDISATDRP